jgi:hypothetical protein
MRAFWLVCLLLAAAAPQARAQGISEFVGRYSGQAIVRNRDSLYFGVSARDLDMTVTAGPEGGFTLTWTSVTRQGAEQRRRAQTIVFVPSGKPAIWKAADAGDLLTKGEYAWARLEGRKLVVTIVETGGVARGALSVYERTRTAAGIDLVYRRVTESGAVRLVSGKLARQP